MPKLILISNSDCIYCVCQFFSEWVEPCRGFLLLLLFYYFLTLLVWYAERGLSNGRVSVRCSSVCPIDWQQQRRRPAGLLLSAGACSRYRSIAGTPAARAHAATNAGSVMMWPEERGWTQDSYVTFHEVGCMWSKVVFVAHLIYT